MALNSTRATNHVDGVAQPVSGPVVNAALWQRSPVLVDRPNQRYFGRVVVEVWDSCSQMMEDCGELALGTVNLKLQLGAFLAVGQPLVAVDPTPMADPARTEGFLGRLVVEAWEDRIFVWLAGDVMVWQRALADLSGHYRPAPAVPLS